MYYAVISMQPVSIISLEGMKSNTCTAVQSELRGEDPATLCPRPSLQAQIVAPMAKRGPPTHPLRTPSELCSPTL